MGKDVFISSQKISLFNLKNIYIDDLLNQFNCKIDEYSKPFYLSIDYFRNGINKKLYNYENLILVKIIFKNV